MFEKHVNLTKFNLFVYSDFEQNITYSYFEQAVVKDWKILSFDFKCKL